VAINEVLSNLNSRRGRNFILIREPIYSRNSFIFSFKLSRVSVSLFSGKMLTNIFADFKSFDVSTAVTVIIEPPTSLLIKDAASCLMSELTLSDRFDIINFNNVFRSKLGFNFQKNSEFFSLLHFGHFNPIMLKFQNSSFC
jgi:hypothetical protein